MIARELRGWIEGKGIQGVKVIPEVNLKAIEHRVRANPIDEKDLNRLFPGDPDGTVSQRLADEIFNEAKKYDAVIDIHTYGTGGRCIPYMLTDLNKDHNVELCERVGLDYAVQTGGTDKQLFLELSKIGVPSMIIEAGGAEWLKTELEMITIAMKRFIQGAPSQKVRFFNKYRWIPVEESGTYRPNVLPGTVIKEGEVLGYLNEKPVPSPVDGLVLGIKMEGSFDPEEENIASIAEF